ncbi:MAG: hypothetical protein HQ574_05750 [Chloroflexi bacterium]|nr:hypothetical protein [Chloroflexota bacterium]
MKNRCLLFLFSFVLLISFFPGTSRAEGLVEITHQEVDFSFGDEIFFSIEYESDESIELITLAIRAPGLPTFVGAVSTPLEGEGSFVYAAGDRPLPAFASISYDYQFTFKSGEIVESPSYEFTYLDNRYNWQELIEEPFKIYWYEGEISLAQEVLDAALQGEDNMLELLQQPENLDPITIFIYSSEQELQTTLTAVGQSWVSGHADPARGSIVVALPPVVDQPLEIQRLVPHEIAHILLYRFMGAEYEYIPAWFSEGLASQMEIYSLPEYDLAVQRAYEGRDLIPFAHLCQAFPVDEELVFLAYAQSDALVKYIQQEFGVTGLQSMIYAYDQGVSCERGVEVSLGITLQELEKDWQRDTFSKGTYLMFIYILIGVLVLLVFGLGGFIFYKMRENPPEEVWDEDEN